MKTGTLDACCDKLFSWSNNDCKNAKRPTRRPTTLHPPTPASPALPRPRPTQRRDKVVVGPIADTFIDDSKRNRNFGNRRVLWARVKKRSTRESLLMFDLSSLRGKCIKKARLSLFALKDSPCGGAITTFAASNVFAHADRWKEDEATWRSIKSKADTPVVLKRLGQVREHEWVHVDVTAGVEKYSHLTLSIVSEGPTVKYASKERRECAPKLSITLC